MNRIVSTDKSGYLNPANMEVSDIQLLSILLQKKFFAMVHFIVQVCTAAGNLLAGNSLRESQPCMLRFFSTHIAAGEFDPTEDVVPQLEALDVCKPAPM